MDTVKIKHSDDEGNDHLIINKSDYDPSVHTLYQGQPEVDLGVSDEEAAKLEARRKYDANRGITNVPAAEDAGRNPSGTFSEPTPTDIRYPDKNATEFENNHGAFIGKSAAGIREELGMKDKPGGLKPEVHEAVKASEAAVVSAAETVAASAKEPVAIKELDDMTVPELREHAKANDIDLDGATTKADIRAAIDKSAA